MPDQRGRAQTRQSPGRRLWLSAILIITALVYSRSLGNGFVADDSDQIVHNRLIGNWSFFWQSLVNGEQWFRVLYPHPPGDLYYRPLPNWWRAVNFHLFGLYPAGWHAALIALHLMVVWLVFRVASHLTADRWTGLLAAVLFALMPLHVEAVVWAGGIPHPLCAAFELGAFALYLSALRAASGQAPLKAGLRGETDGADRTDETDAAGERKCWLALSLGLFGGALLSHESAMAFPALIAAYAFINPLSRSFAGEGKHAVFWRARVRVRNSPLQQGGGSLPERFRASIAAAWPYALLLPAYLGLRLWALGTVSRPFTAITGREAALTIPGMLAGYAMLLLMPWRAEPAHPPHLVHSIVAPGFYLPIAGLAALCGAGCFLLKHHPHRRLHLFCAGSILIALAPMLYLRGVSAGVAIADRYLYFASAGFCVMVADLAVTFARASERRATAVWIGTATVTIVYAAILFHVQRFWHDDVALWSRCVAEVPERMFFHQGLGETLVRRGDLTGARRELEIIKASGPGDAKNRYDLALVYERLGDLHAAAREIVAALGLMNWPPPGGYIILAIFANAHGDANEAEAILAQAAAVPGVAVAAALARAQLRFSRRNQPGAAKATDELLRFDQNDPDMDILIGLVLASGQRYQAALAAFRVAAWLAPATPVPHFALAAMLHQLGREREARDEGAIALAGIPDDPGVRALMAEIERAGAMH